MPRPLRLLEPATTWFVTTRCIDARFLLRPDPEINTAVGVCLARSARRHPGIRLLGFVALSNHLHLLLEDERSELSSFMELFLGSVAKSVNALRRRRGHLFERRFSAEPVLDPGAVFERWLYLALNPVRAGLVARHDQWPGLCLLATKRVGVTHLFRRFRRDRSEAARRATSPAQVLPAPSDFYEEEALHISPLPESVLRAAALPPGRTLLDELRRQEGAIAQARRSQGQGFLGADRVLAQDPFSEPARPKRSPRPLCHTTLRALYLSYKDRLAALRRAYAEASARYRAGVFSTEFPRFLYRPPVPVLLVS